MSVGLVEQDGGGHHKQTGSVSRFNFQVYPLVCLQTLYWQRMEILSI